MIELLFNDSLFAGKQNYSVDSPYGFWYCYSMNTCVAMCISWYSSLWAHGDILITIPDIKKGLVIFYTVTISNLLQTLLINDLTFFFKRNMRLQYIHDLCFELVKGNWIFTHWGRVTHIYVGNLTIIGPDNGMSPDRRQAIIWTKCWDIVNWSLRNPFQWDLNRNSYIFFQETAIENVVCEMLSSSSRPRCVKKGFKCHHDWFVPSISFTFDCLIENAETKHQWTSSIRVSNSCLCHDFEREIILIWD